MRGAMKSPDHNLGAHRDLQPRKCIPRTPSVRWLLPSLALLWLSACSLPQQALRPAVFDFGPAPLEQMASMPIAPKAAIVLDVIEAQPTLDNPAVMYRLAYADPQQLRHYALARWSMPAAQLLRQRLRQHLGHQRALLNPGESVEGSAATPVQLQIELDEFSQLFESPQKSHGLLRLRATLTQSGTRGSKWLAQRSFTVQRDAPSADAVGGVRALAAASDAAAVELDAWLQNLGR